MSADTRRLQRTGLLMAAIAATMVGAAYAAVPLYELFCRATGFGGTTMRADASSLPGAAELARLGGRTIQVRFDGNVAGVPWQFAPVQTVATVKIGERNLAFYRATNSGNAPVTGTASFNVSPDIAGQYFVKIDCFCFQEQTLQPGESVDMPVVYFVDPAILDDPSARRIEEITLSYTFFPSTPSGGNGATETAARGTATRTRG